MYKLTIILRYLRRKLSPMFAALAVMLCTAMVIIVISVMGGFLDMMRSAVQTLEGQIIVKSDLYGFPNYEDLANDLRRLPGVKAVTPVITTFGLLKFERELKTVEVWGIHPAEYDRVVNYQKTLFWTREELTQSLDRALGSVKNPSPQNRETYSALRHEYLGVDLTAQGMALQPASSDQPGIVPGLHVSRDNTRDANGHYDILSNRTLGRSLTLTVLPITARGALLEPAVAKFTVVNEFKSGLYEIDANRVFVSFAQLQRMLAMDPHPDVDPDTGEPTGRLVSGRCSQLLIAGNPGIPLPELRQTVRESVGRFLGKYPDPSPIYLYTWEEKHATFLGAVQNEKMLITILFCIVSLVAFFMIMVVFYMIVLEKTRDIGVLRALGASQWGVAGIFLGYGLFIGVIGSALGLGMAAAIVWNLNEIQTFLGQTIGWQMWNPQVYYFDRIPAQLNAFDCTWIVLASIASSVLGSLIPAYKASRLDPVEALRYE